MSYDLAVAAPEAPSWRALLDAVALPDLLAVPGEPADESWPEAGLRLCREGRSTRTTEVDWQAGVLKIVIRALASPDDCDLALRVAAAAASLSGRASVDADYFGAVDIPDLYRLHDADWMREQADSGTRALATLIRDGRGPMSMPGPKRSCYIGERLLAELEAAGPPAELSDRVLATMRRVQWNVPPGFRDAGVFVSGGGDDRKGRETRFAVWLPGENLLFPRVDYVALRVTEGEIVMVPFAVVAELAGGRPGATLLDECQLLVRAINGDDWTALVARARPLAASPRK